MVGYFGDELRTRNRVALRGLAIAQGVSASARRLERPDHSWLSKTRSRLPHEVHQRVFGWVLTLIASAAW